MGEHLPYKQGVACSSHAPPTQKGPGIRALLLSQVVWEAGETGWLEQNWNTVRRKENVRRCADLTRGVRFGPVLEV